MLSEYKKILDASVSRKKENKSFLDRLKKEKPKDLDQISHEFHEKAFKQIDCLKCANCCATTGPLLKDRDINTLSSALKITPSRFTETYLRVDEDNDYVFKKMPCPFLKDDNCCSVYSSRPGACRNYPHTDQRNIAADLPVTYLNSMICPAVAMIVEDLKVHYGAK